MVDLRARVYYALDRVARVYGDQLTVEFCVTRLQVEFAYIRRSDLETWSREYISAETK